ncbi:MAG: divalent-cation tolerance protein CutA [Deltaproteobacteria bacterium]|nr:divalent-cation tolerance protein CutA [Deltaproteobacteria bacterium]
MEQICLIYSTFPDRKQAEDIAKELVRQRLIACANIMGQATSVYEWNQTLCTEEEVPVIFKTRQSMVSAIQDVLSELHPYSVPCILEFHADSANEAFHSWIFQQTGP